MYRCTRCNKIVELPPDAPIRCPFCGHKILFKERPKVIKTIRAE